MGGKPGTGADGWLIRRSPEVGVIWLVADGWLGRRPPGSTPQLEDGVRHGLKYQDSLIFGRIGGAGILPKGPWHVPGIPLGVEFGSLATLFLSIHKNLMYLLAINQALPYGYSFVTYGHPEGSAASDITIIWNDVLK